MQFVLDVADDVMLMRSGRVAGYFPSVDRTALPSELGQYVRDTSAALSHA